MKINLSLLTFLILLKSINCSAQNYVFNPEIDSLILVVKVLPNDTNKVNLLNNIATKLWRKSQLDSANVYAEKSLEITQEINFKKGEGNTLTTIGIINAIKGNYPVATAAMENSLDIFLELGNKGKIASTYNNLGNISEKKGDYAQALEYHLKSLKLKEELHDTVAMASSYNNIGIALKYQGENAKAIKYYSKALKIHEEAGDKKAISQAYNNLGAVYQDLTKAEMAQMGMKNQEECYDASLFAYNTSLELSLEIEDKVGSGTSFHNIGTLYFTMGDYDKALSYNEAALGIREEIGDKSGQAGTLSNISKTLLKLNDSQGSRKNIEKSLAIALEIGAKDRIKTSYKVFSEVDSTLGNLSSAFENYKLYVKYLDSLDNEENTVRTTQLQMQFEFDKQAAADSVANAKLQELQNALIDKKEAELARQDTELESKKTQQYYLFGGLFLVFVFSGFMYNRFRVTQKQNKLIALQKQQVEDKNILVEKAHSELSEKNKEILDSIVYAKRIQAAILPPKKLMDKYLSQAFVLYQPKDIVAGDFYWLEHRAGKVLFAAADCTGHGVPGAMVSVVCNNGLNRSVREYGLSQPNEILDKTREIVIQEFEKSEEDVNDGMDISLCSVDFETNQLQWSGANNALIIVRGNEVIELKADKQPIGKYLNMQPFTNHEMELKRGDVIYSFTDGFHDQFGGPKGKKYLYKKFRKFLLESAALDIAVQKDHFLKELNNWKGEHEQVDDICIIGVRI